MGAESYTESHKETDKGASYDHRYKTDPRHEYLWSREQEVLRHVVNKYYRHQEVDFLDFACGTGRILSCLEDRVRSATGIDVSESMLSMAYAKLKRSTLIRANLLEANPLEGRTFNLITAFRFLVNAEQSLREDALHALRPLLTDNGYLVINDHQNPTSLRWGYHRFVVRIKRMRPSAKLLSVAECHALARTTGFEVIETYSVGICCLPKVTVSDSICAWCDRFAGNTRMLAQMSESPIFVLRKIR